MKNSFIPMIISLLLFSACTEEIELDVNQSKEQLVIEGLLTDSLMRHQIIVKTSTGFYDNEKDPEISDAQVQVSEISPSGEGLIIPFFIENAKAGHYYPENPFAGKIGYTYKLQVVWKGIAYEAQDVMLPVTKIDSLQTEVVDPDEEISDAIKDSLGTETGPFYWIKFYAIEPADRVDYYNWRFFRNGVMKNEEGRFVFYASDEIVQENINGIFLPGVYTTGDTVKVEQFSLSRIGFLYYYDLESVINSDGGMFSPPPANPRTNLSNGALGFWQVSAVETIEYVVN